MLTLKSSAVRAGVRRSSERLTIAHGSVPGTISRQAAAFVAPASSSAPLSRTAGAGFRAGRLHGQGSRPNRNVLVRFSSDLSGESYVCLGLSHCFEKVDGRLTPRLVIEPVSASSLECMANGARTSFKLVAGTTMSAAMTRDLSELPEDFKGAVFCASYLTRCEAAARTWLRPHAQDNLMDLVPIGKARSGFNFSLEDKRVLNMENVVNDNDNIKQDLSIDVYGRKTAEEAKAAAATGFSKGAAGSGTASAVKQEEEEEEDELDKLLTA